VYKQRWVFFRPGLPVKCLGSRVQCARRASAVAQFPKDDGPAPLPHPLGHRTNPVVVYNHKKKKKPPKGNHWGPTAVDARRWTCRVLTPFKLLTGCRRRIPPLLYMDLPTGCGQHPDCSIRPRLAAQSWTARVYSGAGDARRWFSAFDLWRSTLARGCSSVKQNLAGRVLRYHTKHQGSQCLIAVQAEFRRSPWDWARAATRSQPSPVLWTECNGSNRERVVCARFFGRSTQSTARSSPNAAPWPGSTNPVSADRRPPPPLAGPASNFITFATTASARQDLVK